MRSVFFRRLLIVLIIVMVMASVFMVGGSTYFSRTIYTEIKFQEMRPKADAVVQLELEHRHGEVSDAAYARISQKQMYAAGVSTFIIDSDGKIRNFNSAIQGLSGDIILTDLSPQISEALCGNTISSENVKLNRFGQMLFLATPIIDNGENVGAVVVVKSIQDIIDASDRISISLLWLIAIVIPVMLLIMIWRVQRITAPLHSMSEAAIEMSKGNFEERVNEDEIGEVGVLARALNNLCATLSKTIYQLQNEKGELDAILQSLTDGVAATDGEGALTHYNTALMRMFGAVNVTKREELVADGMIWGAFDEVYRTGETQTITYPTTNERTIWVSVSPVRTENGRRTGVVGLFKDMTETERVEAMRREYVANVSHELRTPLTAVRGLLEPLADGMVRSEEDRQRYYKTMLHEVMRLSRLITDMMTLSKLQSGTEYMELSKVDVTELISDVACGYTSTAQKKGIDLVVDAMEVPEGLTDPDRIEQVLVILLDNAMRYTPRDGSITISIRDGERLLVSVEDTGCGIPLKDLPHIFERFYKVDKSRNEGGTGLGLSIASYIIDKLSETITVDSELGKGTRFTFTIKKYASNAIALGPAGSKKEAAQTKKTAPQPKPGAVVDAPYEVLENAVPPKKRDIIKDIKELRDKKQ